MHRRGVEHREVRRHADRDEPAIHHADDRRRKPGHLSYGVGERQRARLTHVVAEHARERSEVSRMRRAACPGKQSQAIAASGYCMIFTRSGSAPNVAIIRSAVDLEDARDRFTGRRRAQLRHELGERLVAADHAHVRRAAHSARPAASSVSRTIRARAIGSRSRCTRARRGPLPAPTRESNSRASEPSTGEIRIDVGRGVDAARRGRAHHRERCRPPSPAPTPAPSCA